MADQDPEHLAHASIDAKVLIDVELFFDTFVDGRTVIRAPDAFIE